MQRKPGLARDATLSDVAADYAEAVERDLGRPVLLHGTSTGGSVALQIAIAVGTRRPRRGLRERAVRPGARAPGTKRINHPVVGELTPGYETLALPSHPGLSIGTYLPDPGSPSADAP